MRLCTITYRPRRGWSAPFPTDADSDATLVVVFGAESFATAPAPILEVLAAFPRSHVIGCSTSGEIAGDCIHDGTLTVAIARFATATLVSASTAVNGSADSCAAGERIAEAMLGEAATAAALRAVFVVSDGLHVNGSELVRGLNGVLPPEIVVTGGLAGDGDRFRRTWVLNADRDAEGRPRGPRENLVAAIGLCGTGLRVGHGSRGGWDRFGPERVVTRSAGNVLYELDGKPALDLYRTYLGERAAGLPATALLFPLALRTDAADDKRLVRTILSIDETERSMTFAGDIPQGSRAQLMRANFERLIEGAGRAAEHARGIGAHGTQGDTLAIAISCVGRRLILGERAEEEVAAALEALPPAARQIGFYSYGEISPYATGACDLLNQTMTMTTLSEA
ncbi:MAG: FIST C-terminal domain-containing protein [Planctomycetes bacterium]|nr:FIST C-terminal domain-containing protein [Planctomycetota bacterium]